MKCTAVNELMFLSEIRSGSLMSQRQAQSWINSFFKLVYLKFMGKLLGGLQSKIDHYFPVICVLFARSSPQNFREIVETQNRA